MEKKNQKLTIIVGCLLLVISVSLAYFVGSVLINGTGSRGNVTTARINGSVLSVEGILEFNDTNILPGHKSVSSIKVTATGEPVLIPYNLIWKGTNNLGTKLNYTVYKTTENINVSATCEEKRSSLNGYTVLSEECTITNLNNLGNIISSGSINTSTSETKVTISSDEFITSSKSGEIVYYYVILEYPNLNEDQSSDMGGTFEGEVTVEESHASADINILGVYLEQSDGTYKQVDNVPNKESNYTLNESKSTCTNNAKPRWNREEWALEVGSLSQSGTECNIYFDGSKTITDIIPTLNAKTESPDFSQIATTDEGVYAVSDGMYGGTSYYWRGATTTNYVRFGGYCWRIIRINGDGTMRLIYDGTTCHNNGEVTTDSIAVANTVYNSSYNKSEYVGWKYTEGLQRPNSATEGTDATIKIALENWYNSNIRNNTTYSGKVADGKYCNDRNVQSGSTWTSVPSGSFNYVGYNRINTGAPTLSCAALDTYTLKVGLITADEVMYAGGKFANNTSYYLYNGHDYWTMSPHFMDVGTSGSYACMFYVYSNGYLYSWGVNGEFGIRPVINLNANINLSGNGTINDPYEVI